MNFEDLLVFYYSKMDVNQLLQDFPLPFNLYIKLDNKLAAYKKQGDVIKSKDITRLQDNGFSYIYVHNRDMDKKKDFTEKNLSQLLNLPGTDTLFKVDCIYESLTNVTADIYNNPATPGLPDRIKQMMTQAAYFMSSHSDAFKAVLTITRHEAYNTTHPVNVALSLIALAYKSGIKDIGLLTEAGTGGLLHDIGKINIPASIICKKTTLTEAEWELIREHPSDGVKIAEKYGLTAGEGLDIIGNHHEKRNGQGYPAGFRDEDKGDLAEMTSIVDVFDAITSDKPYSMAKPPVVGANFLLSHLEEFDKTLVLLFIKLLSE